MTLPEIVRAAERLQTWADVAPDPLVAIGGDGTVLWGNAAAEALLGVTLDEAAGRNALHLVHPEDLWEATDSLRTTVDRPGVPGTLISVRLRRADGTFVPCEVRGTNLLHEPSVRAIVLGVRDVSDRTEILEALEESARRFQAVARRASEVILLLDADGLVQYVSPALVASTGWQPEDLVGARVLPLVHPDDVARLDGAARTVVAGPGRSAVVEVRLRRRSGVWRYCEAEVVNLLDDPDVGRVVLYLRDITERKNEEARRVASDARFRSAFENAPIGMAVLSLDGRFQQVNEALCTLVGYRAEELLALGSHAITHPDDRARTGELAARAAAGALDGYQVQQRLVRSDGRVVWTDVGVSVVCDERGEPAYTIAQVEDVTVRRRDEARLTYQALHDALTGLPNRTLLLDRLRAALDVARRGGPAVAVLFCDLDRFKLVNDSLGHQAGDRLLVECAHRLRRIVRDDATVARFGGDEFVVLCPGVTQRGDVLAVAARVAEALEEPFHLDGAEFHVTTSVGIAFSVDGVAEPDALLRDADAAMYRAKEAGRARYAVFEPEMRAVVVERMATERALRHAIVEGELRVHYQPIVRLADGALVGAEALVRWQRGSELVPPTGFVALAEETGLIVPLGEWVLGQVCTDLGAWSRDGLALGDAFRVALNLSVRQLETRDFVDVVTAQLRTTGIAAPRLCFELTESALVDERSPAIDELRALRELGCGLAIDDFGTGYSALAHLKRLPFDTLKIDRSFVAGLGRDPEDEAIVGAIVGVARALDLGVVAEGVETAAQAAALAMHGIDTVQGFRFGLPVDAAAFAASTRMRGRRADAGSEPPAT